MRRAKGPPAFDASVLEVDGSAVITVTGEIDMATAPDLELRLDDVLGRQPDVVVIDLRDTAFMDSTGLGVVVRASRRLTEGGSSLVLRSPRAPVRRVLRVTGVERMLLIED